MDAVATCIWFEGIGGTSGCCLDDLAEEVRVVCDDTVLDSGAGPPTTRRPLASCLANCSCGGGGVGETDSAVIEAE